MNYILFSNVLTDALAVKEFHPAKLIAPAEELNYI
jgi:hypothetical protein